MLKLHTMSRVRVSVCVCVSVRVCACVYVRVCGLEYVRACMCVYSSIFVYQQVSPPTLLTHKQHAHMREGVCGV